MTRPWKRLRPRDLFHHPDRVAISRSEAGLFASDGVALWNLGAWESNAVTERLHDRDIRHLRASRADFVETHDGDLAELWRAHVGNGPHGCFQARCTPWNGREFALWAVPHPEHGAFPLAISDRVTEALRGEYFRVFTTHPRQRWALITSGFDVVGAVRPIRFDPGDTLAGDAARLVERFRTYLPHGWPSWGPV